MTSLPDPVSSPQTIRPDRDPLTAFRAALSHGWAFYSAAGPASTRMYTGGPTLDQPAKAIEAYRFGVERTHAFHLTRRCR